MTKLKGRLVASVGSQPLSVWGGKL